MKPYGPNIGHDTVCISQTDGRDRAKSSANLSEAARGYCTVKYKTVK